MSTSPFDRAAAGIVDPSAFAASVFGRRPAGLETPCARPPRHPLGDLFADQAELEEASIAAFETLERELAHHGAPDHLMRGARSAARDEARHTMMVRSLAMRFGSEPRTLVTKSLPVRSLLEIAIENAVEGCVKEAWGALLAQWQSRASVDYAVRMTMRRIAEDESRHAELARQIDRWAGRFLYERERREVELARRDAIEGLASQPAAELERAYRHVAGLPSREEIARMVAKARATIWIDEALDSTPT